MHSFTTELTPAQKTARDIWTSGDYPEVADVLISAFGPTLVHALEIQAGSASSTSPAGQAT